MPLTKPASCLQGDIGPICELCRESREPVYITRDGRADLVVMNAQAFDERDALRRAAREREARRRESIARGWDQARAGELKPLAQVRAERSGA